jgi:anti-sigma-K factor RskA
VNLQEYILSGIVESYVMGLANPEESIEFERMCDAHSEVRAARNAFELQLEQAFIQQNLEPPRALKSRIFSEIGMERDEKSARAKLSKPALVIRRGFARYVAVASLVLLAGSVLLNLYLLNEYKKSIAQYKELVAAETQVASTNQILNAKLENYETALNLIRNPIVEIIKMSGTPTSPAPSSLATVYWNTESREVYLLVNQLPAPHTDKQYQLWAVVDGRPVDAGVITMGSGITFVKLKTIQKADAFAITLEKRGGSTTPTLEAMYVMGKVSG